MLARKAAATQSYIIISDTTEDGDPYAIAIHRVAGSAAACFKKLIADGDFHRYLEMTRVFVNEFGYVTEKQLRYTYTKSSGILIDYTKGELGVPFIAVGPAKTDEWPWPE